MGMTKFFFLFNVFNWFREINNIFFLFIHVSMKIPNASVYIFNSYYGYYFMKIILAGFDNATIMDRVPLNCTCEYHIFMIANRFYVQKPIIIMLCYAFFKTRHEHEPKIFEIRCVFFFFFLKIHK